MITLWVQIEGGDQSMEFWREGSKGKEYEPQIMVEDIN